MISQDFIDEVICDVVPLDICQVLLGSPYLWDRDAIFHRRDQKYRLTKDGVRYLVSRDRRVQTFDLVAAGQVRRTINTCQYVLLIIRRVKEEGNGESVRALLSSEQNSKFQPEGNSFPTGTAEAKIMHKLVTEFSTLFQEPKSLPPKRAIEHEIQLLSDAALPNIGMYRNSVLENDEIKRQVSELIEQGVIIPSSSPCGSPIVMVPKKDGSWRMCVDFRALNKITIKNRYPLPRIDDLLDQLKHATVFSKLDLKSGYHQVQIRTEDTWKTAFKTRQGLYEWMVMPFGLCNAPATFMRLMNDILRPFLEKFVVVYLDDILIYSQSWEEHLRHVREIFRTLQQHQLCLNLKKCDFGQKTLLYLGFEVGNGEIKIDPSKVKVIQQWPRPRSVTEVRSFMGACQYVRRFIRDFSRIAAPLHALTKINPTFSWGEDQEKVFQILKQKIMEAPVLALPNLQKPFEVEADASGYAIGAVLMQEGRPVAYYSETLQGAQQNYPTYDKELLALHQAVKHWRPYLLGKEIVVHTDHQPL